MSTPFKSLYEFSVVTERDVDETTTRLETDPANPEAPAKTITETVKVKKRTPVFFAFREPSRLEREEADIERAVWWNRFVGRGLMPQAELMKKYGNVGQAMSDEQKAAYRQKRVDLYRIEQDLKRAQTTEVEDKTQINLLALKLEELRDDITAFEREQSSFFENTAEAKAQQKLIEHYVLNFSYFRHDETKDWEPFFKGETLADKLAAFDKMVEAKDELLILSRSHLEFLGTVRAANSGPISRENLDAYLKEV